MAVDMSQAYSIRAIWDPEAEVYSSESDVPGLVVEAASLAEFVAIAEELLPQLLKANTEKDVVPGSHIVSGTFGIAV